jgi:hypothetical protein
VSERDWVQGCVAEVIVGESGRDGTEAYASRRCKSNKLDEVEIKCRLCLCWAPIYYW